MKLRRKLLILFVIPIMLVSILSLSGLLWSRYHFLTTVTKDSTKVQMALGMEINDQKANKNILKFLSHQDQTALQSYKDNIIAFDNALTKYKTQILTNQEQQYLSELELYYKNLKTTANTLINIENQQITYLNQVDSLLGNKITTLLLENQWKNQPGLADSEHTKKLTTILAIKVNINQLISSLKGYILTPSSSLKKAAENSLDAVENQLAQLAKMNLTQQQQIWLTQIQKYFNSTKNQAMQIIVLENQKRAKVKELEALTNKTGILIDEKIQAAALTDLTSTQKIISVLNITIILLLLIIAISSIILVWWFINRYFSKPVMKLRKLVENISAGHTNITIDKGDTSEFSELYPSFKKLVANSQSLEKTAMLLGKGQFDTEIKERSAHDTLSHSLIKMRDSLKALDAENKKQVWIKTQINRIIQSAQSITQLQKLTQLVITSLAEALQAGYGAFYLTNQTHNNLLQQSNKPNDNNTSHHNNELLLMSSYGFEERKNVSNRIKLGSGLVGQCAFEKKPILLTEVPDDYIKISSGLGKGTPLNIIVLPILHNDQLLGVIEIASFSRFENSDQTILKETTNSLSTIISNIIAHEKTQELLKKSQSLNEELQTQQEELRSSNEKLEEQTKALQQSEEELRVMNEELEEKTEHLEHQKKALQQAQEDLEHRAKDLALSSKYKSEFLANMSHELRTPLNSLLILSKKLMDNKESNLTEKQVKCSSIIYKGGQDLLTLINDILDLSKVEAGKMQAEIIPCSVRSICEALEGQFAPLATDKGLTFNINIAEKLSDSFNSDEQRIIQILRNFLSNALKFTEQGSVILQAKHPDSEITIANQTMTPDQIIAWSVVDTGIGIPSDKKHAIFEAFQQAEGSTSRKYGGTGLGLAIAKAMAELLGGDIALESKEGQGSTFTLYLPINADHMNKTASEEETAINKSQLTSTLAVQREAIKISHHPQRNKNLLLIVEDDTAFSEILVEFAQDKNYDTLLATTGKEALITAKTEQPDAIILDLGLPDIDGTTVLKELKDDMKTAHIPIHVISCRDENPSIKQTGAIGYLKKPATEESLSEVFNKFKSILQADIKNVLVVEDDKVNRQAITELIDNDNIKIYTTSYGQKALDILKKDSFDCVILDLNLPDMTGLEVLKKLDAEETTFPPIIVYTGKELEPEEIAELQQYTDSIVVKGASSPTRLLDELTLFLHDIESKKLDYNKKSIKMLHSGDGILKDRKVLLVDDDMRNVFALSSELEDYALDVAIASNGQQAINKLNETENIDLVLMDIMMPIMDGYTAIKHIREDRRFKDLPIIALTAKAMLGDREKCVAAGASDYISKPVDIDQLISIMKVWLSKS